MSREKLNILIIDDEKDLCFLLSRFLIAKGFTVEMRHLLHEGLEAVTETLPEWIILDNNLPDGSGWGKVAEIRKMSPDSRIIKVSADPESTRDTDNVHVFYLVKPLKFNSILDIITTA